MKKVIYTNDKNTVFSGKKAIATMVLGSNGYELAVLQGMDRLGTLNKIVLDCPTFLDDSSLLNKVPSIIGENSLKRLNKK
jgi:hypothetical protein